MPFTDYSKDDLPDLDPLEDTHEEKSYVVHPPKGFVFSEVIEEPTDEGDTILTIVFRAAN